MNGRIAEESLGQLRQAIVRITENAEVVESIEAKDQVFARYSPMFQPSEIGRIDEEAFRSFFYFKNNHHWTSLYRQVNNVCANMEQVRKSLALLVDETQPLETRFPAAIDSVNGMGPGIATAILHVAYPNKYGVWNKTSETAMVTLGLMPTLPRGATSGEKYARMNEVFLEVSRLLDVDLWTLDSLWWIALLEQGADDDEVEEAPYGRSSTQLSTMADSGVSGAASFGLERHLQDFLFDNWDVTSLGREWLLFTRPGEPDAGYEFPTPIGRIDLLARHRSEKRWLVIELKRNLTSDAVVGQVLRYMGWIKHNLAEDGETVEGLVIAQEGDDRLHYAISAVPGLSFMGYKVDFHLMPGPDISMRTKQ